MNLEEFGKWIGAFLPLDSKNLPKNHLRPIQFVEADANHDSIVSSVELIAFLTNHQCYVFDYKLNNVAPRDLVKSVFALGSDMYLSLLKFSDFMTKEFGNFSRQE